MNFKALAATLVASMVTFSVHAGQELEACQIKRTVDYANFLEIRNSQGLLATANATVTSCGQLIEIMVNAKHAGECQPNWDQVRVVFDNYYRATSSEKDILACKRQIEGIAKAEGSHYLDPGVDPTKPVCRGQAEKWRLAFEDAVSSENMQKVLDYTCVANEDNNPWTCLSEAFRWFDLGYSINDRTELSAIACGGGIKGEWVQDCLSHGRDLYNQNVRQAALFCRSLFGVGGI